MSAKLNYLHLSFQHAYMVKHEPSTHYSRLFLFIKLTLILETVASPSFLPFPLQCAVLCYKQLQQDVTWPLFLYNRNCTEMLIKSIITRTNTVQSSKTFKYYKNFSCTFIHSIISWLGRKEIWQDSGYSHSVVYLFMSCIQKVLDTPEAHEKQPHLEKKWL